MAQPYAIGTTFNICGTTWIIESATGSEWGVNNTVYHCRIGEPTGITQAFTHKEVRKAVMGK